jgi:hypothetical protein
MYLLKYVCIYICDICLIMTVDLMFILKDIYADKFLCMYDCMSKCQHV